MKKYDYTKCIGEVFYFRLPKYNFKAEFFCLDVKKWELKKGTKIRPLQGNADERIRSARKNKPIINDELTENLIFSSANSALQFVYGGYCSAPKELVDVNNNPLSKIAKGN